MSSRVATADEDAGRSPSLQRLGAGSEGARGDVSGANASRGRHAQRRAAGLGDSSSDTDGGGRASPAELRRLEHCLVRCSTHRRALPRAFEGSIWSAALRTSCSGQAGFDVDIAVEGMRSCWPNVLAETRRPSHGAREVRHRRGHLRGRRHIDVVTARTEFYDAPAALPTVEHATIREDLFRRDFTINAMAVSLKGDDFRSPRRSVRRATRPRGAHDPRPAQPVADRRSDAIFRAIRHENRLGFTMDEHTGRLARATIDMGLVGDLSSSRLRDELVDLLEQGPVRTRSCGWPSSAPIARSTRILPRTRRRRAWRAMRELRTSTAWRRRTGGSA